MRSSTPLGGCLMALAVLLSGAGCPEPKAPSEPPPGPPPDAELLPGRYLAHAAGRVTLGGGGAEETSANGRLQAAYIVYPDDRVVITHLAGRLDDVDLVVPFFWWEVDREPLRCTSFATTRPAPGTLVDGGVIEFDAEALRLGGVSYPARKDEASCDGQVRSLTAENPDPIAISHDPAANEFGFAGSFTTSYEGNELSVGIDLAGSFLNRPPVVHIAHGAAGAPDTDLTAGCPDPKSIANSPGGLRLQLLSHSEDPDPHAFLESSLKLPRADLQREDWVRSLGGEFVYLHEGRRIEEVVFEAERQHVLTLTVTDHSGSRARRICEFFVASRPG